MKHLGLAALLAAATIALLPSTASPTSPTPTPSRSPAGRIIHNPTVTHLRNGRYVAYSTGGVIGARLSTDLHHWDDAGNAFTTPPSWWYDYNSTADPWAPDLSYRDGAVLALLRRLLLGHQPLGDRRGHVEDGHARHLDRPRSGLHLPDHRRLERHRPGGDPGRRQAVDGVRLVLDGHPHGRTGPRHRQGDRRHTRGARSPDAPYAVEGPYIVEHGRYYYSFASYDACCASMNSTYKIRVGRSTSVTGPYADGTGKPMLEGGGDLLLAGHGRYIGTGGESVFHDRGQDWLAYQLLRRR